MEQNKLFELVVSLLADSCSYPADRMQPSTRLRDDLGIGSLELLELALALEERLGFKVEEGELIDNVNTIGDIVERASRFAGKEAP